MIFAAALGIASVLLAPVIPLVLLASVLTYVGANRAFDYLTRKGKRK